jgi:tetratricopeptide (TPR) repeat protein
MSPKKALWLVFLVGLSLLLQSCGFSDVSVRRGQIEIKTNEEFLPNSVPQFSGMDTRGVYPYPLVSNIDYRMQARKTEALFLENKYLKVTVLPEFGGHIFSAQDKITGEQIFWDNPDLKKALIGLTGAWCAFGAEFNFPVRGHIPTSVMPVNHTLEKFKDGAKAVVVGDREYMGGMRWTARIILRPKTPVLEIRVMLENPTDVPKPLYYWHNAAVLANENVQFIFPQPRSSTHGSPWIRDWPVENGTDLSWYKNHQSFMYSRFNRDDLENFMGYYDHGRDFGAFHWADRNDLPFRKFWSWGLAPLGRMWNKRLSDTHGEYVELQSGLFKDQETAGSLGPHQGLTFTHYWMPVRRTGGFSYGNRRAAVSISIDSSGSGDTVTYGLNAYADLGKGTLKLYGGDFLLETRKIKLSPSIFHRFRFSGPHVTDKYRVTVETEKGGELIAYTQDVYAADSAFRPGPLKWYAPDPRRMTEEDYLRQGMEHESQYRMVQACEAYKKGLSRFPQSAILNKALSAHLIDQGEYVSADAYLKSAVQRTRTDPEIDYLLGVAAFRQGQLTRAAHCFHQALNAGQYPGACQYFLGRIDAQGGAWARAARRFKKAAQRNPGDLQSRIMHARALKKTDHVLKAYEACENIIKDNPLAYGAALLLPKGHYFHKAHKTALRRAFKQWQYLAEELAVAGGQADALALLENGEDFTANPMYWYYSALFAQQTGQNPDSLLLTAGGCNPVRAYPHTVLDRDALLFAAGKDPEDATARYLLGTYYVSRGLYAKGRETLEKTVGLTRYPPHAHFVLAMLYEKTGMGREKVMEQLLRALSFKPDMQYAALRLVRHQKNAGIEANVRLKTLLDARAAAGRLAVEALDEKIALHFMELGNYAKAAARMKSRDFHTWEGGQGMRPVWWNNYLLWARALAREGRHTEALAKIDTALIFPKNIHADESDYGIEGWETYFLKGRVFKAMGDAKMARACFEISANWKPHSPRGSYNFEYYHPIYRLFSLKAMGEKKATAQALKGLAREYRQDELKGFSAVLYLHLAGRKKEAIKAAKAALAMTPADAHSLLLGQYAGSGLYPLN